jgi:hypothetical protein
MLFYINQVRAFFNFASPLFHTLDLMRVSDTQEQPAKRSMIDPDRLFRDQDPLDQNARSGAEGSGLGAWDLELSTRKLFGVAPDAPVDYDLFLSLLDAQDRDRTTKAVQQSIDTGCNFDVQYRVHRQSDEGHWVRAVGTTINDPDGIPARLSGISAASSPVCARMAPRFRCV